MIFDRLVDNARRSPERISEEDRHTLASGQSPTALFMTCSDSRIVPSQLTGSGPGELFELRTAGNIVPEYDPNQSSSEMATIEYAVMVLQVPEIILCGHSHCGAVTAKVNGGQGLDELPAMHSWLHPRDQHEVGRDLDPAVRSESKQHLCQQMSTLSRYPFVESRLQTGELRLHGWFYEIDTGAVWTCPYDSETLTFRPL